MKTVTKRTFNTEQTAYILAKSYAEELQEACTGILGPFTGKTDEEIEAYSKHEAEVRSDLGLMQAEQILRKAERDLLTWGIERAKANSNLGKEHIDLLERLSKTPILSCRNRAIDLIMRIDGAY